MSARTQIPSWAGALVLCVIVTSACSSADDGGAGAGGSAGVAGMANGGNVNAGASGSSPGGNASSGSTSGGTAGSSGAASAGASAGGSGGVSAGGGGTGGSGGSGGSGVSGGGGTNAGGAGGAGAGGDAGAFALSSPGWTSQADCSPANKNACGVFPKENIGTSIGGSNKSPELTWTAGPNGTQSYAMVLHDLSNVMGGKPFVHWVMWNIPGTTRTLPAGLEITAMPSVPAGSSQRSYSGNGYQGSGKCGNVYEFVLYALPMATFTPAGMTQTAVADALTATNAPTASLRARSGAPGCTE